MKNTYIGQSAAKHLNPARYDEGSETIRKE